MLQWKILGVSMIIPTITVALVIAYKTWKDENDECWINFAICFWIGANSYWMLCEFLHHEELKDYAAIPFITGMFCVAYFYYKRLIINKEKEIL